SVIEAMAARLPVVAYATGGIPETVAAGETGLLAPLGDTAGLAAHLGTLVADPVRRRDMGARGRARVEQQFTADRTAQRISAVVQCVLDQRK
ncbi:MAG: glycosyltransferase family 4 protein, partial [Anaerolineae bacterium]|nr:glycosyltransferase family 4 protein [Anaerolineae bacterium]